MYWTQHAKDNVHWMVLVNTHNLTVGSTNNGELFNWPSYCQLYKTGFVPYKLLRPLNYLRLESIYVTLRKTTHISLMDSKRPRGASPG
jgi:hypothetical protein